MSDEQIVERFRAIEQGLLERLDKLEATLLAEFRQSTAQTETVIARRVNPAELEYLEKIEYIDGRLVTGPGIELFVNDQQFTEAIRELEAEQEERADKSFGEYLAEKTKKGAS